jgi:hypothetical protein
MPMRLNLHRFRQGGLAYLIPYISTTTLAGAILGYAASRILVRGQTQAKVHPGFPAHVAQPLAAPSTGGSFKKHVHDAKFQSDLVKGRDKEAKVVEMRKQSDLEHNRVIAENAKAAA